MRTGGHRRDVRASALWGSGKRRTALLHVRSLADYVRLPVSEASEAFDALAFAERERLSPKKNPFFAHAAVQLLIAWRGERETRGPA